MPDGSWKKGDILCPFYLNDSERERSITCEGIFHRTRIINKFRRVKEREQRLTLFCAACYKRCEIFQAIMEAKYSEEREER